MEQLRENLVELFNSKKAVIGILGLGYVGQPLALRYSSLNYKTIGFDIDESKGVGVK